MSHLQKISSSIQKMAKRGSSQTPIIRRPSIELAPTMPQPIHIISRNFNGPHLLLLVEELQRNSIPYQLQQETDTLGYALDRHFFVLVDNRQGQVFLGKDFTSKMITLVAYPKVGSNKKKKYCKTPQDVIKAYKQAKASPPELQDCIIEELSGGKSIMRPKIAVKSVVKHSKAPQYGEEMGSMNELKKSVMREFERRQLGIWWDDMDQQYSKICNELFLKSGGQDMIKIQDIAELKKTVKEQQERVSYYYLVNKHNSSEILKEVTKGEVIIFEPKTKIITMTHLLAQPKIYGVVCQEEQLRKVLSNIGFMIPGNPQGNEEYDPSIRVSQPLPQRPPLTQSTIQEHAQKNTSIASQVSPLSSQQSTISHPNKIKRLKGKSRFHQQKSKENNVVQSSQSSAMQKTPSTSSRKPNLKTQHSPQVRSRKNILDQTQLSHSKKNISFKPNLVEKSAEKKKVLKALSKASPEVVEARHAKESATMTEEYYNTEGTQGRGFCSGARNSFTFSASLSGTLTGFFAGSAGSFNRGNNMKQPQGMNAIMYKDFIPEFKNVVQLVKKDPQAFALSSVPTTYGFMTLKEYDRFVRRVKNRLRENNSKASEFNFVTLLPETDLADFKAYCLAKNRSYDEDDQELLNTGQVSQFSSLSAATTRINVFLFVQGIISDEKVQYGRIHLFIRPFPILEGKSEPRYLLQQMRRHMLEVGNWHDQSTRS